MKEAANGGGLLLIGVRGAFCPVSDSALFVVGILRHNALLGGHASVSMHSPDDYRRAAEESRRLAGHTIDKWERESLLGIAADWERLARLAQPDTKKHVG
jgi:hypothetical protein